MVCDAAQPALHTAWWGGAALFCYRQGQSHLLNRCRCCYSCWCRYRCCYCCCCCRYCSSCRWCSGRCRRCTGPWTGCKRQGRIWCAPGAAAAAPAAGHPAPTPGASWEPQSRCLHPHHHFPASPLRTRFRQQLRCRATGVMHLQVRLAVLEGFAGFSFIDVLAWTFYVIVLNCIGQNIEEYVDQLGGPPRCPPAQGSALCRQKKPPDLI